MAELIPTPDSYFIFTLLADDTYEIGVKDKNTIPAEIVIPSSYNGKNITSINGFRGSGRLTSVIIPDSIINIGERAFDFCLNLNNVIIGNGVINIENYAFYSCNSLTSLIIGNSVTRIGDQAFWGCSSLTSITIPDSVTSIGESAFYNCKSLINLIIGNSVTNMADSAVAHCTSLTDITCRAIAPPIIQSHTFIVLPAITSIHVPVESIEIYKIATNWSVWADYIVAIPLAFLDEYGLRQFATKIKQYVDTTITTAITAVLNTPV